MTMPASQTRIEELGDDRKDEKSKPDKSAAKTPRRPAKADTDLRARLVECFERIADSLDTRGDEELAGLIREDAAVMAAGVVSLTRPFRVVRTIVLALVAIVEPVLAFGRIARVLIGRLAERRTRAAEERDAAAREAEFAAP